MNNLKIGHMYRFRYGNEVPKFGIFIDKYFLKGTTHYLFALFTKEFGYGNTYNYMLQRFQSNTSDKKYERQINLIDTYYKGNPPKNKRYVSQMKGNIMYEVKIIKEILLIQLYSDYEE